MWPAAVGPDAGNRERGFWVAGQLSGEQPRWMEWSPVSWMAGVQQHREKAEVQGVGALEVPPSDPSTQLLLGSKAPLGSWSAQGCRKGLRAYSFLQ